MQKRERAETIRRLRVGDLRTLFRYRYGPELPDDDAGRADLELLLITQSLGHEPAKRMRNTAAVLAPWLGQAEADLILAGVNCRPASERKRITKADELGRAVRLTNREREICRAWMIAPVDMSAEDLAEQRKAKDKARQTARRRARGVKSRADYLAASLSRLKPWLAEGISRRSWERRRSTGNGASPSRELAKPCRKSVRNKSTTRPRHTCDTEQASPPEGRQRPELADGPSKTAEVETGRGPEGDHTASYPDTLATSETASSPDTPCATKEKP